MPVIGLDVEARHLRIGDPYRLGIAVFIQFAADRQAGFGRCGGNEFNDREAADEWLAAPGLSDVAEHAMLDLVPLRCSRWVVAYLQYQPGLVGQFLQFELPQPHSRSVRTTAVSGDQQSVRLLVARTANDLIPTPYRVYRESRGIMVDPDAHPAGVRRDRP